MDKFRNNGSSAPYKSRQKLLNKAELFYRLALYGDRKSFLAEMAKQAQSDPGTIRWALNRLTGTARDFWTKNPTAFSMEARQALSQLEYNKDLKALDQAGMAKLVDAARALEKALLTNDDSKAFAAQSISPLVENIEHLVGSYTDEAGKLTSLIPQETTLPEVSIEGKRPAGSVPADVQAALNKLGYRNEKGMPLDVDGALGPETQKALKWFRTQYNVPNGVSDSDMHGTIRYHASRA